MFTGIVSDLGRVRSIEQRGDTRVEIETSYETSDIDIGASIACSGPCLTVVDKGPCWFAVEVSSESLARTTLGGWDVGARVNLERAMRVGEELGGHIVSGHVDGVAVIASAEEEGDSVRFEFDAPAEFASYIAYKGSVALDGVSLTVNAVEGSKFGINIISHTQEHTTFGVLKAGDRVNLEVDTIARYVARLMEKE